MSNRFISETELQQRRQKRQEEWEKVRTPDQPVDAPEEEYDSRSLFERLHEQQERKQQEYEEAHRLKNMVKGLDDDEVDFLDLVDHTKMVAERKRYQDDAQELADYRKGVVALQEQEAEKRVKLEIQKATVRRKESSDQFVAGKKVSQMKLLAGAVKRKSAESAGAPADKIPRTTIAGNSLEENGQRDMDSKVSSPSAEKVHMGGKNEGTDCSAETNCKHEEDVTTVAGPPKVNVTQGILKCVGILPGMGEYQDSSESESTSESEEDIYGNIRYDLVGRRVQHAAAVEKL